MARFHIEQLHEQRFESFLIIPLWEMVLFTSAFRAGDLLAQEPRVPPPAGADCDLRSDRGGVRTLPSACAES